MSVLVVFAQIVVIRRRCKHTNKVLKYSTGSAGTCPENGHGRKVGSRIRQRLSQVARNSSKLMPNQGAATAYAG